MKLQVSYLNKGEEKMVKVNWEGLTLLECYEAINTYALSSIYELVEVNIMMEAL